MMVQNQSSSPLQSLAEILAQVDYQVAFFPVGDTPDQRVDEVVINLFEDGVGNAYPLIISFQDDYSALVFQAAQWEYGESRAFTLLFTVRFPFDIEFKHLTEWARLCLELNRNLALGSFNVNVNEGVYLRYSLVVPQKQADPKQAVEIIDYLATQVLATLPVFQGCIEGSVPLPQAIKTLFKSHAQREKGS